MMSYNNIKCIKDIEDEEFRKKYNLKNSAFSGSNKLMKINFYRLRHMIEFPKPRYKYPKTKYDLEISILFYPDGSIKSICRNRFDFSEYDYEEIIKRTQDSKDNKDKHEYEIAKMVENQTNELINKLIKENILMKE